jgi:HEPN domain-containing protein
VNELAVRSPPLRDAACFYCQQSAEQHLKALLQEKGIAIPKTRNLKGLLNLMPHDKTLASLQRGRITLSRYALEYRYPGCPRDHTADGSGLAASKNVRKVIRSR